MIKESVIAITVTYNRAETLEKNINALIKQTYKNLKNIIIVDNNSNMQNKNRIEKIKLIDERIKVLYLEENLGGAGGFHFGMKFAKENFNADWYWIMDDDAYPREDCLEKLIKNNNLDNVGFLAPLIWGVGKMEYQLYHHKNLSSTLIVDKKVYSTFEEIPSISDIEANAFVGPLISSKVVSEIGIVDKDLFIYGDDTEFTYRITRNYRGYLIKDAIINHEDIFGENNRIEINSWWKQYYKFRNRYLLIEKYSKNMFNKILSKILLSMYIVAIYVKQNFKGYDKLSKKIIFKTLTLAIRDGFNNKSGKTINPGSYLKDISRGE